jgi:hypothetical protein
MTKTKAKAKTSTKRNHKEVPSSTKTSTAVKQAGAGLVSLDIRKAYKKRLINAYFQRQH